MFGLFKNKNQISAQSIEDILKIQNETEKISALHQFCNQHSKRWTETEKLINAIEDFESDVMNGGFDQYLRNKPENEWKEAMLGLEKIGATKSLNLFKKALSVYQKQPEELEALDTEFFKYEDKIQTLVINYAEMHKNDFNK